MIRGTATAPATFELTDESVATFRIDEELRGSSTTVVGTSNIVLGQIQIDRTDLSNSRIGEILVNARAFETDASLRNRTIRGPILDTETFEFISFAPPSIDGLEGSANVGDELAFTVAGDLPIRDVTQRVSFDVTAILISNTTLTGTASTVVEKGPFAIVIPSVLRPSPTCRKRFRSSWCSSPNPCDPRVGLGWNLRGRTTAF